MSEQYFLVRKLGLGKEVVSLSLAVTEVSRGGGMIWYWVVVVVVVLEYQHWSVNIDFVYLTYLLCHVHFHSIEVVRFLFARWRVWARWTRAAHVTSSPLCLMVVQVVGPISR